MLSVVFQLSCEQGRGSGGHMSFSGVHFRRAVAERSRGSQMDAEKEGVFAVRMKEAGALVPE
jgi:hypothetical protein